MNSYNDANPIISFRIKDYQKKKLDNISKKDARFESTTDLVKEILIKYLSGELVENIESKDAKMQDLRMEKLTEEIRYLKIKNDFAENFDKPLSNSAVRMLKPITQTYEQETIEELSISPYDADNKRLQCTDCGVLLTWNSFETYLQQIKEYKNHILSRHNREFSPLEKNVIDNLKYEGKSKWRKKINQNHNWKENIQDALIVIQQIFESDFHQKIKNGSVNVSIVIG